MISVLKKNHFNVTIINYWYFQLSFVLNTKKMILYDEWKGNIPLLYIVSDIDVV